MKGYSLIKEHPTHFEVSHPNEGTFKVAKRPLDPATIKKIRGLPKAMAEGGEVEDPKDGEAPALPAAAGELAAAAYQNPDLASQPVSDSPLAKLARGETTITGEPNPDYVPPPSVADYVTPRPVAGTSAPKAQPEAPAQETAAAPTQESPSTPAPTTAGESVPFSPLQPVDFSKPIGQIRGGISDAAAAQKQGADETAKVYDNFVRTLQESEAHAQKERAALDAENKQIQADIANTKIDPSRVWNNSSTGNKIIAAIGIALSGMGSGLTGQPNLALKVINDTIDRDIDAQKAELGKKQNLLSANLQKYGRLDQALAATRANLLSVAQGQAAGVAARTQGTVAQANAQQLLGQLGLQTQQLIHQVGTQSALARVQSGQTELKPEQIPYLPDQMQKKAVMLPNGKVRFAVTEDDAKEIKKSLSDIVPVQKELNLAKDLMTQVGRTGWNTAANARAQSVRNNLILAQNKLHGLNRLNENELKIFEENVPSPGDWLQGRAQAKLEVIQHLIDSKLEGEYGSRLINYNPGGINFKAQ